MISVVWFILFICPCFLKEDEEITNELITLDKLLEVIPASEGEVRNYLKTIRVIDCDGKYEYNVAY